MNSFRWFSARSWIFSLLFFLAIVFLIVVVYTVFRSKEFKRKFLLLLNVWFVLFLTLSVRYEELYSFELGELLEESVLLRDPQHLILSLYYQAAFWSIFLLFPLICYNLIFYASSALTSAVLTTLKIVLTSLILCQILAFRVVYRWVFPDWLIALNLLSSRNSFYNFEPDIFRIYSVFFEEVTDFILFLLGLNLFYYLSTLQFFLVFWKNNRKFLFFMFFSCSMFLVQQLNVSFPQICISLAVFDFSGFMLFLIYRLNLWKLK